MLSRRLRQSISCQQHMRVPVCPCPSQGEGWPSFLPPSPPASFIICLAPGGILLLFLSQVQTKMNRTPLSLRIPCFVQDGLWAGSLGSNQPGRRRVEKSLRGRETKAEKDGTWWDLTARLRAPASNFRKCLLLRGSKAGSRSWGSGGLPGLPTLFSVACFSFSTFVRVSSRSSMSLLRDEHLSSRFLFFATRSEFTSSSSSSLSFSSLTLASSWILLLMSPSQRSSASIRFSVSWKNQRVVFRSDSQQTLRGMCSALQKPTLCT